MPTSEAQLQANRQNAARSTGPRTLEGKEASRANALKHGMTGSGVVVAEADAIEIKRRSESFVKELNAVGDIQVAIAHRAALNSVRMERGADQQIAAQIEQIRQLEADFVAPEAASDEEADQLRALASRRAMFDPSKEAILARRHESACERSFFRALKELRKIQAEAQAQFKQETQASPEEQMNQAMASFFQQKEAWARSDAEYDKLMDELEKKQSMSAEELTQTAHLNEESPIPFAVGQVR